jgi:hypothetical protein
MPNRIQDAINNHRRRLTEYLASRAIISNFHLSDDEQVCSALLTIGHIQKRITVMTLFTQIFKHDKWRDYLQEDLRLAFQRYLFNRCYMRPYDQGFWYFQDNPQPRPPRTRLAHTNWSDMTYALRFHSYETIKPFLIMQKYSPSDERREIARANQTALRDG